MFVSYGRQEFLCGCNNIMVLCNNIMYLYHHNNYYFLNLVIHTNILIRAQSSLVFFERS